MDNAKKAIKRLKALRDANYMRARNCMFPDIANEYQSSGDAYNYAIEIVRNQFKITMDDVEML